MGMSHIPPLRWLALPRALARRSTDSEHHVESAPPFYLCRNPPYSQVRGWQPGPVVTGPCVSFPALSLQCHVPRGFPRPRSTVQLTPPTPPLHRNFRSCECHRGNGPAPVLILASMPAPDPEYAQRTPVLAMPTTPAGPKAATATSMDIRSSPRPGCTGSQSPCRRGNRHGRPRMWLTDTLTLTVGRRAAGGGRQEGDPVPQRPQGVAVRWIRGQSGGRGGQLRPPATRRRPGPARDVGPELQLHGAGRAAVPEPCGDVVEPVHHPHVRPDRLHPAQVIAGRTLRRAWWRIAVDRLKVE